MELRPRKGRSAQPPSTPNVVKPSPREPSQSSSRRKPASVPSSPIRIPSNDEATDFVELLGSSRALKQETHDNVLLAETPLSDFFKTGRKALSSTTKQKKKAVSTMKKKIREVRPFAEHTAMEEVCTADDTIAVEMVRMDDTVTRDQRASVEDTNAGETLTDDSIVLRKAKKMQSSKKKSVAKGSRRRLVEKIQNGEVALEMRDVKLDQDDDRKPSLVADVPVTVNSDGCHHTLSLVLSDDENVQVLGDVQVDVCERKKLASTLEENVQDQALKARSKKKSRSKSNNFSEESLNRKLFEETAAEPDDLDKHVETKYEKTEKSKDMVASPGGEPYSESLNGTNQSEIKLLGNDDENFEHPDVAVAEEDIGEEHTQSKVSEESLREESFSGYERDEDVGNGHDVTLEIKLDKLKGDAMHSEDHNLTDDDNNSDTSSSDDEGEVDFASVFASSMKAHLHISEPSVSRESSEMQSNQDLQRGEKSPLLSKGSINGNISRLGLLSWAPKVALSGSKNGRPQQAGDLEARPNNVWQKTRCLQDGLCVPPVDPVKLNKLARKLKKDTTGDKWYNLSAPTITPELKKELQLVKLRGVLDPKRHYKSEDSKGLPKYFQVGTVIGGPADFYSGRLTNKEQKNSLANELLSDSSLSAYRKRKYLEIQDHKQAGGKGFMKKKKSKRTPAWAKI